MSLKLQNDQARIQLWALVDLHAFFPEWEINIDADNGTAALECDDLPQFESWEPHLQANQS